MKTALFSVAAAALALSACNKASLPAPAPNGQTATAADPVVATYSGKKVTMNELDTFLAKDLYEMRRQGLETMILRELVGIEAKKAGQSEEEFLRAIAEKAAPAPSDEALQKMYEAHKEAFGGRSFEEVKPFLQARAGQEQGRAAVMAYLDELKSKANLQITLPEPRIKVAAEGPSKGPADAPVTIVEFSDFQCPFCSRAAKTADQVMANYAGKVRLVFRDFPLPFHEQAPKASEAGLCANEQGKFWEMHDEMFSAQDKLSVDDLKAAAKKLGLDSAKFDACLDSNKYAEQVKKNTEDGKEAGVQGTPAFFINGRLLSGAQPYEEFKRVIDEELAKK
ncbi:MAG: DsbA family protein [Myxococcales bacterium]|jgi:protein-disulfide isomerase